jgi:prophage antirepressor-like protein
MSHSTEVTPFNFGANEIRVVFNETNEPLWVAKDICDVLKYKNSRDALSKLDEDEKGVSEIPTPSGIQEMNVINESGLYTLILRSNKPEAKKFKKWVTAEVLPTIRKTGSYQTDATPTDTNQIILEMMKTQQLFIENQQKQTDAILSLVESIKSTPQLSQSNTQQVVYLDSRDRKKLRDAINEKAKEVAKDLGVSVSTISPAIWIELKNFFDVDDYQDIHKSQLKDVMHFVMFWEPRAGAVKKEFVKLEIPEL